MSDEKKSRTKVGRHWCITDYEVQPKDVNFEASAVLRYGVFQPEICPKTGKKHLQGYLEFSRPVSFGPIRKIFSKSVHCEPRMGTRDQARNYCMDRKKTTWGEVVEYGDWLAGGQGKRSDLETVTERVKRGDNVRDIAEAHPSTYVRYNRGIERLKSVLNKGPNWRNLIVEVRFGGAGLGKSKYFTDWAEKHKKKVYRLHCMNTMWFDFYDDEEVLLIDDPDFKVLTQAWFKKITDGYQLMIPVKGGFTWARWNYVYITSEEDPERWWPETMDDGCRRRIHTIIHVKEPKKPKIAENNLEKFFGES